MPASLPPTLCLMIIGAYLYRVSTALPPSPSNATTTSSSATNAVRTICAGPWDTTHLNNGPMLMQKQDCMSAFLFDFTPTATVYQSLGNVHFYDGRTAPPLGVVSDDATFQLPWKVRRGSCTIITTFRATMPLPIAGYDMRTMFPPPRGPASEQDEDHDTFAELYNGVSVMMGACILEPMLPRAGFAIAGLDRRIGIMVVGTGSSADILVGDRGVSGWDGGVDVD
ncbi:MAG: hypothetical protein OHK93_001232 [Ramalina farinacea]|uniref:Uncharacterized protein n=1 Tax=Ramalina farinacea TaxID=258253 RepID=A0AA43QP51_9LECA|nr:hypothetical protein [Ramalina farinacea]